MLKRSAHFYVALCIAFTGLSQPVSAAMIGAEQIARGQTAAPAAADAHERLQQVLARPDVQAELVRQGVDPAEAARRAAALSPDEAQRLASHMDAEPAGGIVGAILTVFFVLLITDILGFTKVFPFTRSVR